MTSYDQFSANSQPVSQSPSQPLENENLTLVRRGLTARPQNSLADFRIRATSYGLEVQFSQRRLRDSPIFNAKPTSTADSGLNPVMIAATVLLVGGSVALTHSTIFGILVAIAIPAFWKFSTPSKAPKPRRTATLRFVNTPKHQTVLSLTTAPPARATTIYDVPTPPNTAPGRANNTVVHFSNLPVELVSANVYVVGGRLSLKLYVSDANGKDTLSITGTRQEIEWLHTRIARWAKETAPAPIT